MSTFHASAPVMQNTGTSLNYNIITIDDDDDNPEHGFVVQRPDSSAPSRSFPPDAPEESRNGQKQVSLPKHMRLTGKPFPVNRSPRSQRDTLTNLQGQQGQYSRVSRVVHGGITLHSGRTVELLPGALDFTFHPEGSLISLYEIFLRIENIEEKSNNIFLTGYHFRRNRNCDGIIRRTAGEVVCVRTRRIRVRMSDVVQVRDLVLTNALGATTYRISQADAQDDDHGRLICRFKLQTEVDINIEDQSLSGWNSISKAGSITRITKSEADKGFGEDDSKLSTGFRGFTDSLDINKTYTFGDICCGAGGATLGAEMAGFVVKFGNDKDIDAMQSWNLNRIPAHGAIGFCEDAFDFVTQSSRTELVGNSRHVDLLHLSIPCQTYSPAHTVPGRNDEDNSAMTGVIEPPLCHLRPRIATLEETDGIIRTSKHRYSFFWILEQFLAQEYNVSWNVLEALDYGCVSRRSRLIILASCPGEKLPPYPLRTHLYLRNHNIQQEALGGLKPPVTVGQALSSLPEHEKDELRQNHYVNFDFPFESTITTGSHSFLSNYHKALLQTFPPTYRFVGNKTSISRQIGNVFPPGLAAAVFKEIMKLLKRMDALRRWERLQAETFASAVEIE